MIKRRTGGEGGGGGGGGTQTKGDSSPVLLDKATANGKERERQQEKGKIDFAIDEYLSLSLSRLTWKESFSCDFSAEKTQTEETSARGPPSRWVIARSKGGKNAHDRSIRTGIIIIGWRSGRLPA